MNRKSDHKGLVQREITVKRGGKTFKQKRWVKAGEDEPAEKKGKKEDVKGSYTVDEKTLESYTVGDEFSFMGEAVIIEKVNNKEKTIKLSDGKVYTLNSIKKFSKPLAESKYKIGDKLIFNGKEKIVKRINRAQEVIEFDDGKLHTFDDIKTFSQEKPKKEIKIKDLKPIKKDPKVKKETKIKEKIKGSLGDGSLNAKEQKIATENLNKFLDDLEVKETEQGIEKHKSVKRSANLYTAGQSWEYNSYLISDRKQGFEFLSHGLEDIDDERKKDLDEAINRLDEFLEKAPKVRTTSYRMMRWDLDNPVDKKNHDSFISNLGEGKIIESKAYSSTTISKKMMKEFLSHARRGEITASIEYDHNGVYLNGESSYPEQKEVLIPRNKQFEIIEIKSNKKNDHYNIKVREVNLNE